jgi:FtsP/CotA-like multicopper oxidase with cupredoxin domain
MASMVSIRLLLLTLFASVCYARRVQFDLRLTWETGAPDGQPRQMVKMNGQFPGPQLNLNYGDSVEFHVHNQLPVEASVHFHGIEQKGTPEYDGVPGLTQTPIQPGDSYTYKWTATQYGSYWYHGHVVGLVSDGLYGAISIQPPNGVSPALSKISNSSRDRGIMQRAIRQPYTALVSDWTKFTSDQYYQAEHDSGYDLYCVDSILLNGKGAVNCQPQSLLDAQVNPNLGKLLQAANLSVSDKGSANNSARNNVTC